MHYKGSTSLAEKISWIDVTETYGRHIIKRMFSVAAPYTSVCDLGAGSGYDLDIARQLCPKAATHAIECYPPNIRMLESKGHSCHQLNIECDKLPFAPESIDVICANQVLEHTKEIFWILHECTRVLKENGYLIFGIPNVAALHNRILLFFGRHPTGSKCYSAHVRTFSKNDFLVFLNVCFPDGYKLEAFMGSQVYPFPKKIGRIISAVLPQFSQSIFFLLRKTKKYEDGFVKYPELAQLETNFYTGSDS